MRKFSPSFNPWFSGFRVETKVRWLLDRHDVCFNPWFSGFRVETRGRRRYRHLGGHVSILGLVDLGLRPRGGIIFPMDFFCFNPWFSGFRVETGTKDEKRC